MPRKKVPLDQRQRSVIACSSCKKAKIRCDAKVPCTTCLKRGRESSCTYEEAVNGAQSRRRSRIASNARSTKESTVRITGNDRMSTTTDGSEHASTIDEENVPQSRMLLSSRLQKVYVGESASLSYLHFLRSVVKRRIGACTFTEGDFNNFMLENDIPGDRSESAEALDSGEQQVLAQVYLDATSGIIDFYNKQDLFLALSTPDSALGMAATYLILAIGAQCQGSSPIDLQRSADFFSQGQKLSFEGVLCNPSIEMVQNFLHMAFYMLGACHRNAAFMYLGVAAQAAGALGLYRPDQYRNLPADEYKIRYAEAFECLALFDTWKSVRVLATIVNSILARSCSLPGMLMPNDHPKTGSVGPPSANLDIRELGLYSIFEMCPFLDELEKTVSRQDAEAAENFLQRLQKWSKALPEDIRTISETCSPMESIDREKSIARMHVACVYYFAVILTTRRFLTFYLLDQIQPRGPAAKRSSMSKVDERTTSLAYVCLDGAVNLARVGHDTMMSNQMLNNMCLLKAWIFAAGLILGFAAFAQDTTLGSEIGLAFEQTKLVLRKLAELSLQAGHYLEMLSSLTDAIALYEQTLANERRMKTSQYLDRIFTTTSNSDSNSGSGTSGHHDTVSSGTSDGLSMHAPEQNISPMGLSLDDAASGNTDMMFPDALSWPGDDLTFNWQSFEAFPNDVFSLNPLG